MLGTALVFWSAYEDGTPDVDMWHSGCIPRRDSSGGGRWLMHKFKSPMPQGMPHHALPLTVAPHGGDGRAAAAAGKSPTPKEEV